MKTFTRNQYIIFFTVYAVFIAAVLFIMPYGDDWGYSSEPKIGESLAHLKILPEGGKWRPLEVIYGYLLGFIPWAYPVLNHIIVVTGHFISAYFFILIGMRFGFTRTVSFWSGILFIISGNTFATFSSVDSINQSLSLAFGVLSVWYCVKKDRINYPLYILFCWLSVLSKESGFLFFLVGPAFYAANRFVTFKGIKRRDWKSLIAPFGIGLLMVLLYFSITFGIDFVEQMINKESGKEWTKNEYYNIPFGIVSLLARFIPMDMPAFLLSPRNYPVFAVSLLLPLPLIIYSAWSSVKHLLKGNLLSFAAVACALVMALSHAKVGAITEMNGYHILFFLNFMFLFGLKDLKRTTGIIFISLFIIGSGTSLIHKYTIIRKTNRLSEIVVNNISAQTTIIPENVLIILVDNESLGHDIYQPIAASASGGGDIMKMIWNKWDMKTSYLTCRIDADPSELIRRGEVIILDKENANEEIKEIANRNLSDYDAVWVIRQNGNVQVYTSNTEMP